MAEMKMLIFSLAVWMMLSPCGALDTVNKKIVNAVCFKDSRTQTMVLDFYVSFNGNQVDRVMALSGDTFVNNEVQCTRDDTPTESTRIQSTVSLSGNSDSNRCGARRIANTNSFKWVIEVRAMYGAGIYVEIDRRYFITCVYDNSHSIFVTAQIEVIGEDSTGTSEKISPVNSMSVLGQQASINRFLSTEYVTIGQNVKLQIGSRVKSQSSSLEPYGVYPLSCDFGPLDRAKRTTFILENGCPATGNLFELTNGFGFIRYDEIIPSNGYKLFVTETESFKMAISPNYPKNDFYYISCYVIPCFGTSGSDSKCTNFCDVSNGRRKRQAANKADLSQISIGIRILDEDTPPVDTPPVDTPNDDTDEAESSSKRLAIIVAVSVSSMTFMVIVLVVAVLVCCRPGCCSGNKDDRLWESSTTSTMSTKKQGSMVYPPPSLMQPKF